MQSARFTVTGSAGEAVASSRISASTRLAERPGFWNRVPRWLPVLQVPVAMEAYPSTRHAVPGLRLYDLDSGSTPVEVRIAVTNGLLFLAMDVAGGVPRSSVTGNGTSTLRIIGEAAALARTLASAGALEYEPSWSYLGPDTISFQLVASGLDPGGPLRAEAAVPVTVRFRPTVLGRWVFYNQSVWDGGNPGADTADDAAIAIDKTALLPGIKAGASHYTTYARGLNGVMVDISGIPLGGSVSADDFEFRTGNDEDPAGWSVAPAPVSVSVRRGGGVAGSDRVTLIWGTNAVKKAWLGIVVKASGATGLEVPDTFYFGNAVGDALNSAGVDAVVDGTDEILTRQNARGPFIPADITSPYDFNRDGLVNATDQLIARANGTTGSLALRLITPVVAPGGALAGPSPSGGVEVRLVAWRDSAGWVRVEADTGGADDAEWALEGSDRTSPEGWVEVARGVSSGGRVAWRIRTDETRTAEFFRLVSRMSQGGAD